MDDVDHFLHECPKDVPKMSEELLDVHCPVLDFPWTVPIMSQRCPIFAGAQAEARWRGVAVRLRQLSGGRGGAPTRVAVWIFDTLDGQL